MFGIDSFSIDLLTSKGWLVWPALAVLTVMSVYLYRRTNPPLSRLMRIVLGALRLIAVFALFISLLEPVVGYSRGYERSRRIAVLADASSSMNRIEQGKSRRERLDSLLASDTFARLKSSADITGYYFGGNLVSVPAEVDSTRTAIGDLMLDLQKLELSAPSDYWLLFSDGNSNFGSDPAVSARGLSVPTICIDMATSGGAFDVGINDIEFNRVVFVGEPTTIRVNLQWQQSSDRIVGVELLDSDRAQARGQLHISQEAGQGEIYLKYIPDRPGQKILKINLPQTEADANSGNNQRSISLKVLKSKILVLLVTDQPDYEVGFLKRFFDRSDRYDLDLVLTGDRSGNLSKNFPRRQTELNRYDLVILHDPDPGRLSSRRAIIESYLSDRGGAIWLMMGQQFASSSSAEWLDRLLPFSQSTPRPAQLREFHGSPVEGQLFHPVVRMADDRAAIRNAWAELPPFKLLVLCDRIDKDAVILVDRQDEYADSRNVPILGFRRHGPGKLLASAVLPLWNWGFGSLSFSQDDSRYRTFLEGTASWLTVRDDFDPVRVTPVKQIFSRGETIRFDGFAYDQGFRPIPSVTGMVRLQSGDGETLEADLISVGDGKYQALFDNAVPGKYQFSAVIEKDGQLLKEEQGNILVETFSLEQYDQNGSPALLAAVSRLSGGKYLTFDHFDEIVDDLDLAPVRMVQRQEIVLWNKTWLLVIILAAFSIEWLLRKFNQLV